MTPFLVAAIFLKPQLWARGFAAPPRLALTADVNGDGLADLIAIHPPGASIIDISLNIGGQRAGVPFQGLTSWGNNCQAALAGNFDGKIGADIVGLFDGQSLRLAADFRDNRFQVNIEWAKLPKKLEAPNLALRVNGQSVIVWSSKSKVGYEIVDGQVKPALPTQAERDSAKLRVEPRPKGLTHSTMPKSASRYLQADADGDGDLDWFEVRYGTERHSAYDILLYRCASPGDTDGDHDGLTDDEENARKTDPSNSDTDNDGYLDGWEVKGFRGLDLPGMGCDPNKLDLVVLISRFSDVPEAVLKTNIDRVQTFYDGLGWNFHPVSQPTVSGDDMKNPWWVNRDKFLPQRWKGLVHWMQVTNGGGGQADQMGDGGTCGINALWQVFVHEFGHQMGMDHEGFWPNNLCPIYTSLMNYAYSYGLEDDGNKIHYSDGQLANFVLRETDLDETLPLPYAKVKFLEKGPYRFRLKDNGATTLIDWNWNGVFGEKHIRADINYSYSTNAGVRDEIGKTMTAPWLFTHKGKAFALYGTHEFPGDVKTDPSISPEKVGDLWLREMEAQKRWKTPLKISGDEKLAGDPVAISDGKAIYVAYATQTPPAIRFSCIAQGKLQLLSEVSPDVQLVPTLGRYKDTIFLFLWNPKSNAVQYRTLTKGQLSEPRSLLARSTIPVGMTVDTLHDEIIIGSAQNQDKGRTNRWQVRRYLEHQGQLIETGLDWIEGPEGGSRGTGRCTLLFDASRDAGPGGRIYFFAKGLTSKDSPWACTYVAHQIADKSVHGGWLVKRFYDEWTQSRSAPAACWFNSDILWAYRWVDGSQNERDNIFHVGYHGLGIQEEPMGDHDDIGFLKNYGIKASLIYLGQD